MRRLLALSLLISSLACGCAAGLAAPAALAAGSTTPSFSLTNGGATPPQQTTTVAPVTSTTSSSSGGLSGLDVVIIVIVGGSLMCGVAFWIWYDARGHSRRAGPEESLFGQRAHAGSKAPRKPRKLTPAERKRRKRGRAR